MYAQPQAGATVAAVVTDTLTLAALRRNLLALVVGNALFTDAEQLRTAHNAHDCGCPVRLVRWVRNARRVAAERETAQGLALMSAGIDRFEEKLAARLAANVPTASQCDELHQLTLHPALTAAEKQQTKLLWPGFTYATATAYIGKMWVRVLERGGRLPKGVQLLNG